MGSAPVAAASSAPSASTSRLTLVSASRASYEMKWRCTPSTLTWAEAKLPRLLRGRRLHSHASGCRTPRSPALAALAAGRDYGISPGATCAALDTHVAPEVEQARQPRRGRARLRSAETDRGATHVGEQVMVAGHAGDVRAGRVREHLVRHDGDGRRSAGHVERQPRHRELHAGRPGEEQGEEAHAGGDAAREQRGGCRQQPQVASWAPHAVARCCALVAL